ncbi:MAG: UDP-N-acetylmuramate dehydrogenase [Candidatus Azotimanducaceae bacterium]
MDEKNLLSLTISYDVSLKAYNTFGMDCCARYFCIVETLSELEEAIVFASQKALTPFILGSGSNIVLLKDLDTLVISIQLQGIKYDSNQVTVMAGQNWHKFVRQMVRENRFGLENLSFIPGLVGAAPVQNIGAYGVELADRLVSLTALDRHSGEAVELSKSECQFAYRDSVFKNKFRDKLIITSISLNLDSVYEPILDYKDLSNRFSESVTALEVSNALIEIRMAKIPDPRVVGNVGSFFKNPLISEAHYQEIMKELGASAAKTNSYGMVKVSAAMLIAGANMQGKRVGDAVVSTQHALVLTNAGSASREDVTSLITLVQEQIRQKYFIKLEVEPELVI